MHNLLKKNETKLAHCEYDMNNERNFNCYLIPSLDVIANTAESWH